MIAALFCPVHVKRFGTVVRLSQFWLGHVWPVALPVQHNSRKNNENLKTCNSRSAL